jgi:hypothetical protein
MSAYKPFTTADVIVTPFKVNKTFTFEGTAALTGSGIDIFEGENTSPLLWISGSTSTGYISTQDKFLVYRSIRELYYYNYLTNDDGSPANTASFNTDGTITGLPYTPNAYNYLPNTLLANRYFPTGSGDIIGVISIPSNKFGEYVKPGTLTLSNGSDILVDDGEGNLLSGSLKVGDIIYSHGILVLTSDGLPQQDGYGYITYGTGTYDGNDSSFIQGFTNSSNLTCSFQSNITLYETQYKCTIRENEFNFSQNPTLISGSSNSGTLYDYATGSYFTPYITTIGLYNNNKELLAVAKLAQPLRVSDTTDTSIMINLDL